MNAYLGTYVGFMVSALIVLDHLPVSANQDTEEMTACVLVSTKKSFK